MEPKRFAQKLIDEPNARGRRKLITAHRKFADVSLAESLTEKCFEVWASEPTVARRASHALTQLSAINRDPVIAAHAEWVQGIALITRGRLADASDRLEAAGRAFISLGLEHLAGRTMVARLLAVAMLGEYKVAKAIGTSALDIFERHSDELAAGKIELNLSNVAARRGRYTDAKQYGQRALTRFEKIKDREWQAMAENSLANTYADLNDFRSAERLYRDALASARGLGMTVTEAEIEASLGNLAVFRGSYGSALNYFESSRRKYEDLGMPHQSAIADLEIAYIYAELGLYQEAFEIYAATVPKLRSRHLRAEEARARANFGHASEKLGRYRKADSQLRAAARLFENEGNLSERALAELSLARLEANRGNYDRALEYARRAGDMLSESDNPRHALHAQWSEAEILRTSGDIESSAQIYRKLIRSSAKLEQRGIQQAALNALGKVAVLQGRGAAAVKRFEEAAAIVEDLRAPLPGEEFRMAFLGERLEPFLNLAQIHTKAGNFTDALIWIERARSRTLAESIVASRTSSSENPDPLFEKLSARREELNWLYGRFDDTDATDRKGLSKNIHKLEKEISALQRRVAGSSDLSGLAGHTHSELDISKLQKRLGKERALIEFVEFDGHFSAFVITDAAISFIECLASRTEIERDIEGLRFQLSSFKYGATVAPMASILVRRTDAYLERLLDKLLARPLEQAGSRALVIVPSGPLNYIPFHALRGAGGYLIESREVVIAPGAVVWLGLDKRRKRKSGRALLMGFADESIPLVNAEIDALGKLMPEADRFTGSSCSFAEYLRQAPGAAFIHLACHGDFRAEDPSYSSLHLAEGWVTAGDVARQKLNAELVTLSACDTGINK
ncbi:MAG TPA: CHAT domain-containing protein, partial [Pyrinomonadaceae bacterium]|nr:CHAT domain-containing protein [Pyrinomonadaceae bacterium]